MCGSRPTAASSWQAPWTTVSASGASRTPPSASRRTGAQSPEVALSPSANLVRCLTDSHSSVSRCRGHRNERFCATSTFLLSSTGRHRVVSGSEDSKVYIWDLQTRKVVQTLEGHQGTCRVPTQALAPRDSMFLTVALLGMDAVQTWCSAWPHIRQSPSSRPAGRRTTGLSDCGKKAATMQQQKRRMRAWWCPID